MFLGSELSSRYIYYRQSTFSQLMYCTCNDSFLFNQKNEIDYIVKEDADIIALQQTKCDKDKMPDDIKLPGYHHYFLDSKIYSKKHFMLNLIKPYN